MNMLSTCRYFLILYFISSNVAIADSSVKLPVFPAGSSLVFGEVHGTKESPEYFSWVVSSAMKAFPGEPLVVGLEFPQEEEKALSDYLSSNGGRRARNALLSSPFWTRNVQDGRSSGAMFELVELLRKMKRKASNLEVRAIVASGVENKDAGMARIIDAILESNERARILILVGNLHAKRTRGSGANEKYESMVRLFKHPNRTFAFRAKEGNFWGCVMQCGEQKLTGDPNAPDKINMLIDNASQSVNFDGILDLGRVSPSAPAYKLISDGK